MKQLMPSWRRQRSQKTKQNSVVLELLKRHRSTQPSITGKLFITITMATISNSSNSRHCLLARPKRRHLQSEDVQESLKANIDDYVKGLSPLDFPRVRLAAYAGPSNYDSFVPTPETIVFLDQTSNATAKPFYVHMQRVWGSFTKTPNIKSTATVIVIIALA